MPDETCYLTQKHVIERNRVLSTVKTYYPVLPNIKISPRRAKYLVDFKVKRGGNMKKINGKKKDWKE